MTFHEQREQIVIENQGQKIFGMIHRPVVKTDGATERNDRTDAQARFPAVLICHGLGGNKVGKHRLYLHLAERLAKQGIIALRIDFRGSGDSEGEFGDMTIDGEVSDAIKALEYLKNDPQVDTDRMAIFGRSFGGVVAILAANYVRSLKAMVLWAPVFSGAQWKGQWEMIKNAKLTSEHRDELMSINGMKPGSYFFEQLFALDLTEQVANLEALPLLHFHGQKDELVNLGHAEGFKHVRQRASGKTKFVLLPHTNHDFSHAAERNAALEESVAWFKAVLKKEGKASS